MRSAGLEAVSLLRQTTEQGNLFRWKVVLCLVTCGWRPTNLFPFWGIAMGAGMGLGLGLDLGRGFRESFGESRKAKGEGDWGGGVSLGVCWAK
jgi:hypothetical protein